MNLSSLLPVVLLIAFFGLLAIAATAAFIVSLIQQRRYDNAALPSLEDPEEEKKVASEDEEVTEYRFETPDEELVLEDEETNQLMRNISKLDGSAEQREPKKSFSLFNKKPNNKGKDGDLNANSQ